MFIEEETVREYLYGDLASHLIGYLGIINAEELRSSALCTGVRT